MIKLAIQASRLAGLTCVRQVVDRISVFAQVAEDLRVVNTTYNWPNTQVTESHSSTSHTHSQYTLTDLKQNYNYCSCFFSNRLIQMNKKILDI
jgi:hypothetical protein